MKRERLTITLESALLEVIDRLIDKDRIRNRSHAIEHVLREGLGLHQLSAAFFFFGEPFHVETFLAGVKIAIELDLPKIYLVLPNAETGRLTELRQLATGEAGYLGDINLVPADFGTAAALLLQKNNLEKTILCIDTRNRQSFPTDFISALSFHRQHGSPCTQLIREALPGSYGYTGCCLLEPSTLNLIPPGTAELESTLFPTLLKTGRIRGYITT